MDVSEWEAAIYFFFVSDQSIVIFHLLSVAVIRRP